MFRLLASKRVIYPLMNTRLIQNKLNLQSIKFSSSAVNKCDYLKTNVKCKECEDANKILNYEDGICDYYLSHDIIKKYAFKDCEYLKLEMENEYKKSLICVVISLICCAMGCLVFCISCAHESLNFKVELMKAVDEHVETYKNCDGVCISEIEIGEKQRPSGVSRYHHERGTFSFSDKYPNFKIVDVTIPYNDHESIIIKTLKND